MRGKKLIIYFLISMLIIAVSFTIFLFSCPARRPARVIKNDILRLTPIGTDIEDVFNIANEKVKTKGWSRVHVNHEMGYFNYDLNPSAEGYRVGVQSVTAHMGTSWLKWHYVDVSWGLDEDGKLIDVYIRKRNEFFQP